MKYKCNKCGKIVERESTKRWIPSMCDDLGVKSRLYLYIDHSKSRPYIKTL